ncbi:MAG: hypothetical protein V4662_13725 [Verrucomicrobiota bacterium]
MLTLNLSTRQVIDIEAICRKEADRMTWLFEGDMRPLIAAAIKRHEETAEAAARALEGASGSTFKPTRRRKRA